MNSHNRCSMMKNQRNPPTDSEQPMIDQIQLRAQLGQQWLLIKGVNVEQWKKRALASA